MSFAPFAPLQIPLSGVNLIDASAGTGKTYSITTLYLRLLLEQQLNVDQILVVTFTEAATAELRDRIRTRLRQALDLLCQRGAPDDHLHALLLATGRTQAAMRGDLRTALSNIDEAAVFTIHGFCARTLLDSAFESGAPFDTEMVTNLEALYEEVAFDFWVKQLHDQPPHMQQALKLHSLTSTSLASVAKGALKPGCELDPAGDPPPLVAPDLDAAFADLCATWAKQRDAVLALPAAISDSVSRYKEETVRQHLARFDLLLSSGLLDLTAFFGKEALIDRYATATLRAKAKKNQTPPANPFFDACERFASAGPALDAFAQAFKLQFAHHARREVPARLQARDQQSFDDLIIRLDEALKREGQGQLARRIRQRYRAALIDEFQDTDPVQWSVFAQLFGGRAQPLFLIGDPKQSIYGFRNADIYAYLRAARGAAQRFTMDTNYRSDAGLVRGVNTLFGALAERRQPFMEAEIPFHPVAAYRAGGGLLLRGEEAPAISIRFLPRAGLDASAPRARRQFAAAAAADLAGLLAGGATLGDGSGARPLDPGDVAVLVRTHKQARAMEAELARLHIPTVRVSNESVFESDEGEALRVLLAAIVRPTDAGRLRAALAGGILGLPALAIHLLAGDEGAWDGWLQTFADWRTLWRERGFMSLIEQVLDQPIGAAGQPGRVRLMRRPDGERRLTNLRHLAELVQTEALSRHLQPEAQLRWLEQMRDSPEQASGDTEIRLESDAHAVKLVTIFKAKGLEYPLVFCPFLWDGAGRTTQNPEPIAYHDPAGERRARVYVGVDPQERDRAAGLQKSESQAETMRLLYVALTRARHQLVIHWGLAKGAQKSPLAYLLHCPSGDQAPDAMHKAIAAKTDDQLRTELATLAAASDGSIAISTVALPVQPGPTFAPVQPAPAALDCPAAPVIPFVPLDTASFSRLTQDAQAHLPPPQREGLDRDEADAGPAAAAGPLLLADMPRGVRAGDFFHELYEHLDFTLPPAQDLDALVAGKLRAYGFDAARWQQPVCDSVRACLATPLDAAGLRLGQIGPADAIREMEFTFPAGNRGLALAEAFRDCASAQVPAGYAERIAGLRLPAWQGFLKGFIDLVFVHQERWYLLDYKSNHLGAEAADYRLPRLQDSMAAHHYVLQYHLYAVALHRFLARRRPGFDPARHFGGVFYLYLRGLSPAAGPDQGVFFDRPSPQMIAALERIIGREVGP